MSGLLKNDEYIISIDINREVSVRSTADGEQIVITLEDPHCISIVAVPKQQIRELIDALTARVTDG